MSVCPWPSNGFRRSGARRSVARARQSASRLRRDEDGGPLVEFTVFLPLFMLIVFGMIGFGAIFYVQNSMVNAARHAVRAMSVQNLTEEEAQAIAADYLTGLPFDFTITTDDCLDAVPPTPGQQDARVMITVPAAQAALINYLGAFTGRTLTASVRMRKEQVCT